MKQTICIIIALLTIISLLTGCNSTPTTPTIDIDSTPSTEVVATSEDNETLVSQDEAIEIFKQDPYADVKGYNLDDYGYLSKENEGSLGCVHTLGLDILETPVFSNRYHVYYWENNTLKKYSFGSLKTKALDNYTYCGYSDGNGFVFRKSNEVYLVSFELDKIEKIADNVKFVIDCDYQFNSDAHSQPLFIMNDGSIKCYVSWEEELLTPTYEGGYGGTYIQ